MQYADGVSAPVVLSPSAMLLLSDENRLSSGRPALIWHGHLGFEVISTNPAADLCVRPSKFQCRTHEGPPLSTRSLGAFLAGHSDSKGHDCRLVVTAIPDEGASLRGSKCIVGLGEREGLGHKGVHSW